MFGHLLNSEIFFLHGCDSNYNQQEGKDGLQTDIIRKINIVVDLFK